jgi:hypothetical protein
MTEDLARRRFMLLSLLRLAGVAVAFLGVAIVGKRLIEPADIIGGALIVTGALTVLILPRHVARAWRTPPAP